jgi:archaeal flagellar protein FlaI
MKEKKTKTEEIASFLSNELVDENQSQIPSGYEVINRYELNPPFSYALILYNNEKSDYLYFVDELKLNSEEEKIYQSLYHLIEESLESTDESKGAPNFEDQLTMVMKENAKMFLNSSSASLEKVKYYLRRDVSGFNIIEPIMRDVNIEDVSCSGSNNPIYIWHRKYDSIPTNIQFASEEKLNSFISRIVFRAR